LLVAAALNALDYLSATEKQTRLIFATPKDNSISVYQRWYEFCQRGALATQDAVAERTEAVPP
jgi:hypothetical protein